MPALIKELIDKVDNFERIRDQIGAILKVEQAAQQQLALDNGKNPKLSKLRVFVERSNPWSEFADQPDPRSNEPKDDTSPIVNVWFGAADVDEKASDVVEKQKYDGVFNIDCYGYGVSTASLDGGHDPGDARSAFEAHRAARLVRNILMAGHYAVLGLKKIVARRMVVKIQPFKPEMDDRPAQHVDGCRVVLGVDFKELSPQVKGEPLESMSIEVTRIETGELLFEHEIEFVDS